MKHKISFALTDEEIDELGYKKLSSQMCISSLSNIILYCEEKNIAPRKDIFFEEDKIHRSLVGYAKGFAYERLSAVDNKMTDFLVDGKPMRFYYIIAGGKKEAIPVITDYYIGHLWATLRDTWLCKKNKQR